MRRTILFAILIATADPSAAQSTAVTTSPGKTVQIGYYSFLKEDCSGGAKPTVRPVLPPAHGEVIVRSAVLTTKRLKQCAQDVKAPAVVVLYKADDSFVGSATVEFDVVNSDTGQARRVSAIVNVAADKL